MVPVLIHVMIVVFIATLIRSAFGFGEALIAVPLLAFRIPVDVAAPLAVLISITVAGVIVVQDWRRIHIRSVKWLLISTCFGIPLGLAFLEICNDVLAKAVLGTVIVAFSSYSLMGRSRWRLHHDSRRWLLGCGFFAGVLGGAYGMNGPPLAMYGAMRRWSPQHFRATLQGYFLPASLIGMAGYWLAGLWTRNVTRYYLWCLPATLIALSIGRAMNNRLAGDGFLRYVYLLLIAVGTLLLFQALHIKLA